MMDRKDIPLTPTQFWDPKPEIPNEYSVMIRDGEFYTQMKTIEYKNNLTDWQRRQIKTDECSCDQGGDYCWDGPKEEVCEDLKYYELSRLRWSGFEIRGPYLTNGSLFVSFHDPYVTITTNDTLEYIYYGPCSAALFELICQENGIELEPYG